MGVWTAGAGVSKVRGGGDDAEAGSAGSVDLLVSGVPALGGDGSCSGGTGAGGETALGGVAWLKRIGGTDRHCEPTAGPSTAPLAIKLREATLRMTLHLICKHLISKHSIDS